MSKKIYRLKPWNEVDEHHLISKTTWDDLASREKLDVEFLKGLFSGSVMIHTKGALLGGLFVKAEDIYEVKATEKKNPNETSNVKTYTKDDIRKLAMKVMTETTDIEDEKEAIIMSLALAKLINELN